MLRRPAAAGHRAHNVYVSTNEFSILKPRFNGAQLYVVDKSDLVAGAAAPSFVHIGPLHADGALAGSVQPAITVGPSNAEYFMSSLDNTGQGDHRIVVWALTHRDLHAGVPRLTKTVIDSQHYAVPPPTRQLGAPTRLDSGDDRMQQVQAIGGRLWVSWARPCGWGRPARGLQPRPGSRCCRHLHDGHVRAHIRRRSYVASPGNGVLYPAIAGDRNGNAVMGFSVSGAGMYPSAGFARIGRTWPTSARCGSPATAPGPIHRRRNAGATTRGRCSTRPLARCGWPTSTSRPRRARRSMASRTGALACTPSGFPRIAPTAHRRPCRRPPVSRADPRPVGRRRSAPRCRRAGSAHHRRPRRD